MAPRKPFLSIAGDIDDDALEAVARMKGVPSLTPAPLPTVAAALSQVTAAAAVPVAAVGQGAAMVGTEPAINRIGPTPRSRMSYVKACMPDYALTELKTRALQQRVSINHLLLKALDQSGIHIKLDDMIEDGRRLRGRNAVEFV